MMPFLPLKTPIISGLDDKIYQLVVTCIILLLNIGSEISAR